DCSADYHHDDASVDDHHGADVAHDHNAGRSKGRERACFPADASWDYRLWRDRVADGDLAAVTSLHRFVERATRRRWARAHTPGVRSDGAWLTSKESSPGFISHTRHKHRGSYTKVGFCPRAWRLRPPRSWRSRACRILRSTPRTDAGHLLEWP